MASFIAFNKTCGNQIKGEQSQHSQSYESCRLWDWIFRKLKSEPTVCNKQAHNSTQLKSSPGIGLPRSFHWLEKSHTVCCNAFAPSVTTQVDVLHNILPNPYITHPSTELPINTQHVIYESTPQSGFMKIIYGKVLLTAGILIQYLPINIQASRSFVYSALLLPGFYMPFSMRCLIKLYFFRG